MRLSREQLEWVVVAEAIALAVAVGIWVGDATAGTVIAGLFAVSMWAGSHLGGRRRMTQALAGLAVFATACAAAVLVWIVLVVVVLSALGGAAGLPGD